MPKHPGTVHYEWLVRSGRPVPPALAKAEAKRHRRKRRNVRAETLRVLADLDAQCADLKDVFGDFFGESLVDLYLKRERQEEVVGDLHGCARCGTIKLIGRPCEVCAIKKAHAPGCTYRRAAEGVAIACEHGRDVCPTCDPCTCGAAAKEGGA